MFEGMSEKEKALFKEFIDKKREEESHMTKSSNVANTQTKAEKFRKLKEKRLKRTLVNLDLIANLATNRYDYMDEEANQVVAELMDKVKYIDGLFKRRLELKLKKSEKTNEDE